MSKVLSQTSLSDLLVRVSLETLDELENNFDLHSRSGASDEAVLDITLIEPDDYQKQLLIDTLGIDEDSEILSSDYVVFYR